MYLQNVLIPGDSLNQALAIALALSESVLGDDGAYRVHGGGLQEQFKHMFHTQRRLNILL